MTAYGGRKMRRTYELCSGCGQRLTIGDPKAGDNWPAGLSLSRFQVDLLLVAAAEFDELAEKAGIPTDAADFVDWMAVDALGLVSPTRAMP